MPGAASREGRQARSADFSTSGHPGASSGPPDTDHGKVRLQIKNAFQTGLKIARELEDRRHVDDVGSMMDINDDGVFDLPKLALDGKDEEPGFLDEEHQMLGTSYRSCQKSTSRWRQSPNLPSKSPPRETQSLPLAHTISAKLTSSDAWSYPSQRIEREDVHTQGLADTETKTSTSLTRSSSDETSMV